MPGDLPDAPSCLLVPPHELPDPHDDIPPPADGALQTAVLAGGCFWCTEAVFQRLEGVQEVTSGYAGGDPGTADYRSVCTGQTGHAEVIQVRYDPQRITFGQLLRVFFSVAHDPTQLNRQGNDRGTQYRSAIFYADEAQQRVAQAYIRQLAEARVFRDPIVTTLEPLREFYPAEGYHQNYAVNNPAQPYVAYTALPKVEKLERYFSERVRRAE
jgi:peptide-methionine (S)-S-oxide reductase